MAVYTSVIIYKGKSYSFHGFDKISKISMRSLYKHLDLLKKGELKKSHVLTYLHTIGAEVYYEGGKIDLNKLKWIEEVID